MVSLALPSMIRSHPAAKSSPLLGSAYPVDRRRGLAGQQQGLGAGDVAPPGE
jgi:hypothetical protein